MNEREKQRRDKSQEPSTYSSLTPEALKKQRQERGVQLRQTRMHQLLKHPVQHYRLLCDVKQVHEILHGPQTDEIKLRLITQIIESSLVEYRGIVDQRGRQIGALTSAPLREMGHLKMTPIDTNHPSQGFRRPK